ncbi:MAG: MBL fold metallo-hydrolase [Lachnospiraceae bacterium]|nr:MBL fold metallo-hydrolase [Lachnospiraceae bacterium]
MKISFFHVGIATCLIMINENIKIAIDPALSPQGTSMTFKSFVSERTTPPKLNDDLFEHIDLWLITHLHQDHCDEYGVKKIEKNVPIIMHPNHVANFQHFSSLPLSWGETQSFHFIDCEVSITAVPAYHGNSWVMRKLVGVVNGYILKISNERENFFIYFTSDTVYHKNIIKFVKSAFSKIDLLVANLGEVGSEKIGGPLTMSVSMLEHFAEELHPNLIIPVHIDDMSHYTTIKSDLTIRGFNTINSGLWHTIYPAHDHVNFK